MDPKTVPKVRQKKMIPRVLVPDLNTGKYITTSLECASIQILKGMQIGRK